jgi:hypothetical protein
LAIDLCNGNASGRIGMGYKGRQLAKGWRTVRAVVTDAAKLSEVECKVWGTPCTRYAYWSWVVAIRHQIVIKSVLGNQILGFAMMSKNAESSGWYVYRWVYG